MIIARRALVFALACAGCVPAMDGASHPVEKHPAPADDIGALIDEEDAAKLADQAASSWVRVCEKTRPRDRATIDGYESECAAGKAKECMHLGRLHMCGAGLDKNPRAALPLFDRACTSKDADGCHMLANALLAGAGGRREPAAGLRLYAATCEGGSARLCGVLGSMLTGLHKPRSMPRGIDYLDKACAGGEHDSCADLAMTALSRSGTHEPQRAIAAASRGCRAGHADSCAALGGARLLTKGDTATAVRELEAACDAGSAMGCSFVGFCYARGVGVAADRDTAIRLLRKGCDAGSPSACRSLAKITGGAPPPDLDDVTRD